METSIPPRAPIVDEDAQRTSTFDKRRRWIGAICGPICAFLVWLTPITALTPQAHMLLAIMTLVCLWWITEPVPIPVTSLLGPTLCVILGVTTMKDAFAAFANPTIFLFMGGFIIAKAMTVNGIDRRISYGIVSMRWVGDSPRPPPQ